MTIYLTRNKGPVWERPWPSWKLIVPAEATQIVGTLVVVYGFFMMATGWPLALLVWGYRAPKAEPPPLRRLSTPDFQSLLDENPEKAADFRDSFEITDQLGDLMADQVQKDANADPLTMFMALESVLRSLVTDMGSPKDIGELARFLRDHPDHFPMFSTVPDQVPSTEHFRRCKATLQRFICEKREVGQTDSAIFGAFMNMYMHLGSQVIGALNLARRIEDWDPEHQAKLRQVGLRSPAAGS